MSEGEDGWSDKYREGLDEEEEGRYEEDREGTRDFRGHRSNCETMDLRGCTLGSIVGKHFW